jgi:hypothetical protein
VSITPIARQAQGIHMGEVIAKLTEDAYFMRIDNRVAEVPPVKTHEARHHESTSRSPTDSSALGPQLEDPPRAATTKVVRW